MKFKKDSKRGTMGRAKLTTPLTAQKKALPLTKLKSSQCLSCIKGNCSAKMRRRRSRSIGIQRGLSKSKQRGQTHVRTGVLVPGKI